MTDRNEAAVESAEPATGTDKAVWERPAVERVDLDTSQAGASGSTDGGIFS